MLSLGVEVVFYNSLASPTNVYQLLSMSLSFLHDCANKAWDTKVWKPLLHLDQFPSTMNLNHISKDVNIFHSK
jgi:hypothetical protein